MSEARVIHMNRVGDFKAPSTNWPRVKNGPLILLLYYHDPCRVKHNNPASQVDLQHELMSSATLHNTENRNS